MRNFIRAFTLTMSIIILAFGAVVAFVLINENIGESGFSSGEVLSLEIRGSVVSGEFMGEEFMFGTAKTFSLIKPLFSLVYLFPPYVRLFLRFFLPFL